MKLKVLGPANRYTFLSSSFLLFLLFFCMVGIIHHSNTCYIISVCLPGDNKRQDEHLQHPHEQLSGELEILHFLPEEDEESRR